MAHRRSLPTRPPAPGAPTLAHPVLGQKKTAPLTTAFNALFARARAAFDDPRVYELAHTFAQASVLSLGRHTIAGTLTTAGRQQVDWSSVYRLFERGRFDPEHLFAVPLKAVLAARPKASPLFAVLDDTRLPKRGKKIADSAWRHDSQGPPFAHQILWAQRLVELSALLPATPGQPSPARAIPVDLQLQSVPVRPGKMATDEERRAHKSLLKSHALPAMAAGRVAALRQSLDEAGEGRRALHVAVDGGYTNKTLFRAIPTGVTLIGRIRKDAKLFAPPPATAAEGEEGKRGRRRLYGKVLATPKHLLDDKTAPWKTATVFAAGRARTFEYKTQERCRWASGAGGRDLRVVVVRPLTGHDGCGRLFFTHPGYLVSSDPELAVEEILQAYVWRWEIEVGFREQKTQLGLGEAQVWTRPAVSRVLAFQAFVYGLLLLAGRTEGVEAPTAPKWRGEKRAGARMTLGELVGAMREEVWGEALSAGNKTGFACGGTMKTKPPKLQNTLKSAVIYASR